MQDYIGKAARQVELRNSNNSKIRNFADYNTMSGIRYNTGM